MGGGYYDFGALGEASTPTTRAAQLEEGLEVLTELWSGEPYHHEGPSYSIKEAGVLPPPLQSPRTPIWVAARWPAKAPLRRAARWGGVIPIGRDLPLTAMLAAAQMRDIVRYVASQPGHASPFEVVHSGLSTGRDATYDRELVAAYQQVGATWWLEKILPEGALGGVGPPCL